QDRTWVAAGKGDGAGVRGNRVAVPVECRDVDMERSARDRVIGAWVDVEALDHAVAAREIIAASHSLTIHGEAQAGAGQTAAQERPGDPGAGQLERARGI